MGYRANVTDKQQDDVERAAFDSAIRFQWFDGKRGQVGKAKNIRAYDLQAQADAGGSPSSAVAQRGVRRRMVIGNYNDNPNRFETPGRA
jgi:hypothetical protein